MLGSKQLKCFVPLSSSMRGLARLDFVRIMAKFTLKQLNGNAKLQIAIVFFFFF